MTILDLIFLTPLAYLDPGSGSLIIQMIVAGLVGFAVFFRGWFASFMSFFSSSEKNKDEDDDIEPIEKIEQSENQPQ